MTQEPVHIPEANQAVNQPIAHKKPWYKSQTVIMGAIAAVSIGAEASLQSGSLPIPVEWSTYLQYGLEVVAFIASGGAIHGRLIARALLTK